MRPVTGTSGLGFAGALVIHGALLSYLFLSPPPQPAAPIRRPPVKVRLATRPPKPTVAPQEAPLPEPAPPKEIPPPEPVKAVAKVAPPRKNRPRPPRPQPKPPQAETPPVVAPPPPRPRKFTVSMDAVVPGGGVAVPTSPTGRGWAFGSQEGDPNGSRSLGLRPGTGGKGDSPSPPQGPFRASEVKSLPRLLSQPSASEIRASYPPQARREGLEANVVLQILVSERGEVTKVRMVKRAGQGFDEAAQKLVRQFKFIPGKREGKAISVWIPWTYKFRLDG